MSGHACVYTQGEVRSHPQVSSSLVIASVFPERGSLALCLSSLTVRLRNTSRSCHLPPQTGVTRVQRHTQPFAHVLVSSVLMPAWHECYHCSLLPTHSWLLQGRKKKEPGASLKTRVRRQRDTFNRRYAWVPAHRALLLTMLSMKEGLFGSGSSLPNPRLGPYLSPWSVSP